MKKIFLFATIAAAGLFASCSSSDDAVSDAPNNPIEDADGRQAIKIGITNIANKSTRGTGTVGGVDNTAIPNVWSGQYINTFMFTQLHTPADPNAQPAAVPESWSPTLDLTTVNGIALYDNQKMVTPGSDNNLIDGMNVTTLDSGEAMIEDGTINYYPVDGRYDFFGYHGDDAVNSGDGITKTADKWTVPFEIDGSQDLMSTKAVLTATQATIMASKTANRDNYYSAYAARQGVQPTLSFNHLLTRLQFKVKAGNDKAAGKVAGSNEVPVQTDNVNAAATSGDLTAAQALNKAYIKGTDGDYTLAQWQNTLPVGQDYVYSDGDPTTPTITKFDITQAYAAAVPAGQNVDKAVKVTSIKIKSKNTGDMAVAWLADPSTYTYEMSMISKTDWDNLTDQTNWGTAVHSDPADLNSAIVGYEWTGAAVDYSAYLGLTEVERKYATAVTGTMTDAQKITWGTSTEWLTLKDRPYAKKKTGAAAVAYTDFTDGTTLNDAATTAAADLTAAETALAADPTNAALIAARDAAQAVKDKADAALAALLALETDYITEYVWNKLSNDGQQKYDDIHTINRNENLIALSPTIPDIDLNTTTDVGEALIVAPNDQDYEMMVTVQQDVPTSWSNPTDLTTKETEYPLTIKAPAGGFKVNTSYNIILTVYSLERIEVIAVVTAWDETHKPIDIGKDE